MLRKIGMCLNGNFRQLFRAPGTWALVVYTMLLADIFARGIRQFCESTGEKATAVFFPVLLNSPYRAMLFLLGVFLLFMKGSFFTRTADYEIPRMGRKVWLAGQTIYIWLACMCYVAAAEIICNALLLPGLIPKLEWGRVFTTLARTSAGTEFASGLNFDYGVMVRFSAGEAVLLHYLITCGVCFLFSYLLFTLNLWTTKIIASGITGFLILFPILTSILNINAKYILSPVSWIQLSRIDRVMTNTVPSLRFIACMIAGCSVFMFIVNWIRIPGLEWGRGEEDL